jgi:hypothetical protein
MPRALVAAQTFNLGALSYGRDKKWFQAVAGGTARRISIGQSRIGTEPARSANRAKPGGARCHRCQVWFTQWQVRDMHRRNV